MVRVCESEFIHPFIGHAISNISMGFVMACHQLYVLVIIIFIIVIYFFVTFIFSRSL